MQKGFRAWKVYVSEYYNFSKIYDSGNYKRNIYSNLKKIDKKGLF